MCTRDRYYPPPASTEAAPVARFYPRPAPAEAAPDVRYYPAPAPAEAAPNIRYYQAPAPAEAAPGVRFYAARVPQRSSVAPNTIKCPLLPEIHRGHSITWLLTKLFPDKKERLKIKVNDVITNVMATLTTRSEDNFTRRTVENIIVCKVFHRYTKTNSDALFHDILLPNQSLYSVNLNEVRIMSTDGISIKNSKHPLLNMVPFQGRYISLVDLHDQIPKSWPGWDAKVSGLGRLFLDGLFDSA